ncbi:FUSC family protein [Francisella sp. Scap27]|uniref:FUSC family protein n=1 Tax=Francisella sp. Scap27 TaxID=2589986 RepID=UPI0015BFA8F4|nr:FUSC family protein [Francisella sp. Scap27]QLE78461.1 FUSC family protein [Francisella sp. Scap27]
MLKEFIRNNQINILQCFKILLAINIVLYISICLDLYKPMWAVIGAIFLQLRPEAGFVVEKTICLIAATLIGAIIGTTIVVLFIPFPFLAILSLVFFLIICLFISAGMSHPNFTYGIALGNITAIVIVFYSASDPENITATGVFNIAAARFTEIGLGCITACLVSFLIKPQSVKSIYKKHSSRVFLATINHLSALTDLYITNNSIINTATREIIEATVTLHSDSSANMYETINAKNRYILFSNRALAMLRHIKDYSKYRDRNFTDDNYIYYSNLLNNQLKTISLDTNLRNKIKELKVNSKDHKQPIVIRNLYTALISFLIAYINLGNIKSKSLEQINLPKIKNYHNLAIVCTSTIRTISIFIICTLLWILSNGSPGLLVAIILMVILSQLFGGIPKSIILVRNVLIGVLVSAPIAVATKLFLMPQVLGFVELFLVLFSLIISIGIICLTIPRLQIYGLGYCLGIIFIIQPDNHMNFDIISSLSTCIGLLIGGCVFYTIYTLLPNAPNILTQKLAIKALYGDLQKIGKTIHNKDQFVTSVAKKVLCVYKYELPNNDMSKNYVDKMHDILNKANKYFKK